MRAPAVLAVLAVVACLAAALSLTLNARAIGSTAQPARLTALVTVLADAAAPVASLTAADFSVREGDARREVIDAVRADGPLSVAMLVDTVQPPMGTQAPVRDLRAGFAAFAAAIRAHERDAAMSLTEFGGAAVTSVPFGAPAEALDHAIARLYPNRPSHAVLLEALVDVSRALGSRPAPRRAIVSVDLHSPEGSSEGMMARAAEAITQSGATYWAISVRGLAQSSDRRDAVLDAVTKSSGGLRLIAAIPSGIEALLTQVAASLASQYTVTFSRSANQAIQTVRMECRCGNPVAVSSMMR